MIGRFSLSRVPYSIVLKEAQVSDELELPRSFGRSSGSSPSGVFNDGRRRPEVAHLIM
jgi:hypothetical protein